MSDNVCVLCGGWGARGHDHPAGAPVVYKIDHRVDRAAWQAAADAAGIAGATFSPGPGRDVVVNGTRGGRDVRLVATTPADLA